ncbi:MAG: site-2 protease family protein [Oscillospiraceae bacterium]|nr:site-2 protease family protein [Oscillospiraceae bacterium]
MADFSDIIRGMNWGYLLEIAYNIIPALLSIVVHETCHGLAALAMGDRTAKRQGRLSLNPLRHIDPFGLLMLVVFKIGWAKPVSVDMRNFRDPKRGMAVTALAGPASNFVLAALSMFAYGLLAVPLYGGEIGTAVLKMLGLSAYINISLGLFNLIPFPPLDGSKVLFALLPGRTYMKLMRYERYGMIMLVAIVFGLSRIGISPVGAAAEFVFDKFTVLARLGAGLTG